MKRFIELIKQKWLKDTVLTILLVAIIIFIYLMINMGISKLNLKALDFTAAQLYTITDDSKEQIKNVEQNVDIYFWGYEESDAKVSLGRQYSDINPKIQVQVVSYLTRPDLATTYGVTSTTAKLVIVSSNQRNKLINDSDMTTYDLSTYKQVDITEQKLTNAILDVTIVKKPQVYFLTGHNEYSIGTDGKYSTLGTYITNDVNDVSSLNLTIDNLPETCDVLIIANPTKDFSAEETMKLKTYINNGGKIIWLQDPDTLNSVDTKSFTNMQEILGLYGVSFSKGIICETSTESTTTSSTSSGATTNTNLFAPILSYNAIVQDLYTDGQIILFNTGKIDIDSEKLSELNVQANTFVKSTEYSYYTEDVQNINTETSTSGPFAIGTLLEKKIDDNTTSSMVVFSSAIFASDLAVSQNSQAFVQMANNKDIVLNSVAYLTDRADSIKIRKTTENVFLTNATTQQTRIVVTIVFSLPLMIILIGIIVPLIRKRRR